MRNFDVIEIIKKQIVKGIKDNVFYLSTINLERKTININIYHSKKNQNSDFYTNIAQTIGMSKQDNIKLFAEKLAKYLNKNKKIFINVYADKINMIHFKINHTYFFKYLLNFNNTIFKKESKLLNFKMYNISCPSFLPVQEFDIDDLNGILISNSIINILKYYGIRSDSEMFIYNEPKACAKISEETTAVYKSLFQTKTNLFPSKIEFEIASWIKNITIVNTFNQTSIEESKQIIDNGITTYLHTNCTNVINFFTNKRINYFSDKKINFALWNTIKNNFTHYLVYKNSKIFLLINTKLIKIADEEKLTKFGYMLVHSYLKFSRGYDKFIFLVNDDEKSYIKIIIDFFMKAFSLSSDLFITVPIKKFDNHNFHNHYKTNTIFALLSKFIPISTNECEITKILTKFYNAYDLIFSIIKKNKNIINNKEEYKIDQNDKTLCSILNEIMYFKYTMLYIKKTFNFSYMGEYLFKLTSLTNAYIKGNIKEGKNLNIEKFHILNSLLQIYKILFNILNIQRF